MTEFRFNHPTLPLIIENKFPVLVYVPTFARVD